MKFWVGYGGCKCPDSGPFAYTGPFLGPSAKTAPSWKAVLFNGQILAEVKPGLIWTGSRDNKHG